jgi:hypothetical protein
LIRSYAAEALTGSSVQVHYWKRAGVESAQAFLENSQERRESVESEPGVYRQTEVDGDGFRAFELASLLPGTRFEVHLAKMAE